MILRTYVNYFLLHPGDHIYGWIGDLVDILSIAATMFGICTSLGLSAAQLNTGLNRMNPTIEISENNKVIISWAITARKVLFT